MRQVAHHRVYSSESITLQRAGKESCGVSSTTTPAPQNTYVVLPGGDPLTSNASLQTPSCSYLCTNTNGPAASNPTVTGNSTITGNPDNLPVNNQSNPYLPPFDTYYRFKNADAQCKNCPDQNQKHFVKVCHSRFPNANNGENAVFDPSNNVTTLDPVTKQFRTTTLYSNGVQVLQPTMDGCVLQQQPQ